MTTIAILKAQKNEHGIEELVGEIKTLQMSLRVRLDIQFRH